MTERLPVKLTPDELAVRANMLARGVQDRAVADEERRESAAQFRTDLKMRDDAIAELAHVLCEGAEDRDVEVRDEPDYPRGTVRTIRMDTGDVVRTRALTTAERQGQLPGMVLRMDRGVPTEGGGQ